MSKAIRFTKGAIAALAPAQAGKRDYYEDLRVPALRLSVTASGAKSWVVQRRVQGRVVRLTLGRFPDMTPENAKKAAERIAGQIASGADPRQEKRRIRAQGITLGEVFEEFLKVRGPQLKPSTIRNYRQLMNHALADWQSRSLREITKDAVLQRHAALTRDSGGAYANVAMRTLRAVWNFGLGQYEGAGANGAVVLLPSNPVQRLSQVRAWNRTAVRTTYVREHELPAWFSAVESLREAHVGTMPHTVGDYLVTLILTGLRRREAARLTWEDVDFGSLTLRVRDTKNHNTHVLPIPDYLLDLLKVRKAAADSLYVFPGEGGGFLQEPRPQMQHVMNRSGITFTIHDLRRTFITFAERLDLSVYVLSRLANHKLGHPITRDYIVTDIERLRAPMQRITDFMLRAARATPAVVAMRSAA